MKGQGLDQLPGDPQGLLQGEAPWTVDTLGETPARVKTNCDKVAVVRLVYFVDRDNIGMFKLGKGFGFLAKA